jgi:serine/threonine-protein kinase
MAGDLKNPPSPGLSTAASAVSAGSTGSADVSADSDLRGLFAADSSAALDPVLPGGLFVPVPKGSGGPVTAGGHRRSEQDAELPGIGAIIDKYRLEEMVGKGGFAAVYRATHLLLNMPVAIKLLRPKAIRKQPRLAELLCEEAKFAARINHPNVVRIYDVTHTDNITFVVMEFIEGGTLSRAIEAKGRLSPRTTLKVGLDVTAGLNAGLEQGLIHRDIKPSNILFAKNGVAKIVDLGLAQPTGEGQASASGKERYRKMTVVGTPGYMAPEQGMDPTAVDFRADIYSLGVTLYQASVGKPPFPIKDPAKAIQMHREDPVPAPDRFVAEFPRPLSRLLLWMLAKTPAERPSSYDELTRAMTEAMAALPVEAPDA